MEILLLIITILVYIIIYYFEAKHDYLDILQKAVFLNHITNKELKDVFNTLGDKKEHLYDMLMFIFIHLFIAAMQWIILGNFWLAVVLALIGGMVRWIVHDGLINKFRKLPWCKKFSNDGVFDFWDRVTIWIHEHLFPPCYLKILLLVVFIVIYLYI